MQWVPSGTHESCLGMGMVSKQEMADFMANHVAEDEAYLPARAQSA